MMLGWDGSLGRGGLGRFQATPDNYHYEEVDGIYDALHRIFSFKLHNETEN